MAGRGRAAALGAVLMVATGLASPAVAEASGVPAPPMPVPAQTVGLASRDLVWDQQRDLVYALLGPTASPPDSIAVIDGATGQVVRTVPTGPDPDRLELATDASRLFVGVAGAGSIVEYALPDLSVVRQFSLGTDPVAGARQALDIAAMPGRAGSVAVALGTAQRDFSSLGVAIYDDGVARLDQLPPADFVPELAFGATGGTLYGSPPPGSGTELVRMSVDAAGVRIADRAPGFSSGALTFAAGRLYVGGRFALDPVPATPVLLGSFERPLYYLDQGFAVDAAGGRAWLVLATLSTMPARLVAYDLTTFQPVDEFTLPPTGTIERVWRQLVPGPQGRLALRGADRIVLLDPGRLRGATGEFTALTPARILDTRTGLARPGASALGPGEQLDLVVTGAGGVPADGVGAVVLNATVTEPTVGGYVTVWPAGIDRPVLSNVNFVPGQTVANLVTVAVGRDGAVSIANAFGSTHVVVDVVGFYADTGGPRGSRFRSLSPTRLFDTRDGRGGVRPSLGAGEELAFRVLGTGGVPSSRVTAVVMNVTVTGTTGSGYVTVYPGDVERPLASNLNVDADGTLANLVVVRVPASGEVRFFSSGPRADLVADVVGYYDDLRFDERGRFLAIAPFRAVDTRLESPFPAPGALLPRSSLVVNLSGEQTSNPSPLSAWVLNVTVAEPTADGYLTVYPNATDPPLASNVNFVRGQAVPNAVMVPEQGLVAFFNSAGSTHVVVDVFGAFT